MDVVVVLFGFLMLVAVIVAVMMVRRTKKMSIELAAAKEREESLKTIVAEKDKRTQDFIEEEGPPEEVFDGLITKNTVTKNGVVSDRYQINESKMPKFGDARVIISYAMGFARKPEDPSVLNLAGYGSVMRTETYVGFKLLMQHLLNELRTQLNKDAGEKPSTEEGK